MDSSGEVTYKNILRGGWLMAWRNRYAMALYTIVIWTFGVALLIPLVTWILHQLGANGDVIVGNYSIHLWLFTPQGVAYLLLAGSLVLFTIMLQGAGLFLIADTPQGATASVKYALRRVVVNLVSLLKLSFRMFLIILPFVLIVAVIPGIAYLLLLTDHDINFYLANHPPEWIAMIAISTLWISAMTCGLVFILIRWLFVLPFWLEGVRPLPQALRKSWHITHGRSRRLLLVILVCALSASFVGFITHIVFFGITGVILEYMVSTVTATVHVISGYLVLNTFVVSLIGFLGLAWGASVWVLCFRSMAENNIYDHASVMSVSDFVVQLSVRRIMRRVLPLLVIVILGSWGLGAFVMQRDVPVNLPLIIAHRAGAADAPENTLVALERVIKDGVADIAEIDVTLTLDGKLVIAHDKDLMRQANDSRVIAETLYDDFCTVDIGEWFGPEFKGLHLGRLEEFLKVADGEIPMIVEFKHGKDTNLVEKTVELVQKLGMEDKVILMSLELDEVRKVQELAADIKVGYFASVEVGDLRKLDVDILAVKDHIAKTEFVRDIHEQGGEIYVWTIDDKMRVMELVEMGVDGIITNDPDLVVDVVRRFKAFTPEQRVLLRFRNFWTVLRHKKLSDKSSFYE
ncbi:MAG: hypothetical protein KAI74_04530 [Kiritimatiellae bacterium]|nr:hypothetical protein [Kiritimatiellia bacterium]